MEHHCFYVLQKDKQRMKQCRPVLIVVAVTEYLYNARVKVQRVAWVQQIQKDFPAELVISNCIK